MKEKMSNRGEYTNLCVESLNLNGVNSEKLFLLENYVIENEPDVLLLQETKVNADSLPPNMNLVGYNLDVKERTSEQKAGGGLAIYWKEGLVAKPWSNPKSSLGKEQSNEIQWILLESGSSRLAIGNVYMACQNNKTKGYIDWNISLYNQLKEDINTLRDMNVGMVIAGDYNAWVGRITGMESNNPTCNENGKLLKDFVASEELFILNTLNAEDSCFTRKQRRRDGTIISQSCLDYALISNETRTGKWSFSIHDVNESEGIETDHNLIRVIGSILVQKTKKLKAKSKPIFTNDKQNSAYKKKLKTNLTTLSIQRFERQNSTEQVNFLHNAIKGASLGTVTKKPRKKSARKRRVSQKTKNLLKEKADLKEKIKQQGNTEVLAQQLIQKQHEVKDSIVEGLIANRKKVRLELALKDPNRKTFWRMLRRSPIKNAGLTAAWDKNKKLVFEPKEVRKAVYDSFKGRLNGHDEPQPEPKKLKKKKTKISKELSRPVTLEELRKLVPQIKNGKAPGPYAIHGEHIRQGGMTLLKYLKIWINTMMKEGKIPEFLKQGRVTLIYKRDDCLNPANYRPITITSVLLKLFTRVLNVRLDKVVEKHKFLSEQQYGFRKNKSTADAIFVITAAIEKAKQEGMDAGLASIDLSAAYDMVSRTSLFKKLHSLGISGNFLEILQDYYTNDSVVYVVGQGLTKALYLTQGVKQGCNLSPLLFNLFLVDVIEAIHQKKLGIKLGQNVVTIISYADDLILLVECIENMNEITTFLTEQCANINMKAGIYIV